MQAKARAEGSRDLYEFWGDTLYQYTRNESRTWINLASKEYSKCIEKYLQPEDTFLTIQFGEYLLSRPINMCLLVQAQHPHVCRPGTYTV